MENNWIITAKIHISEADFKLWLASSAKFATHAELFNCDSDDPFVNILLGGSIKAAYGSIAKFFANELSEMILSFDRESLLLYYNNISSTLNFAFEINRYNGFNTAVYNTALLLSIASFKNNDKADFCLISSKEFANICYAIEITKNGIKIIKINIMVITLRTRFCIFSLSRSFVRHTLIFCHLFLPLYRFAFAFPTRFNRGKDA